MLRKSYFAMLAFLAPLGGCGVTTPEMSDIFQKHTPEEAEENFIVNHIKCELREGVRSVFDDPRFQGASMPGNNISWLKGWGAKVTLALTVDEKSGLNPGVTFTDPRPNSISHFPPPNGPVTLPQAFSFGLGATLSADATRKETIGMTYAFADLLSEPKGDCEAEQGSRIESDLKIGDFISNKIFIARVPGAAGPATGAGPFNVFSYEATFVLMYGGNVTPTWKFARFSANTAATAGLVNAGRTDTQYVTITLGKVTSVPGQPLALSPDANDVHNANVIGHAVDTGLHQ